MNKDNKYIVTWCSVCNQGWIEIVKEEKTGVLFFSCDECEVEWEYPEDINFTEKGSRFKYGKVIEPNYEEIKSRGWDNYIMKDNYPISGEGVK